MSTQSTFRQKYGLDQNAMRKLQRVFRWFDQFGVKPPPGNPIFTPPRRREQPSGQPIRIVNTASSDAPQGAFCQLLNTMDSTNTYFQIAQPTMPAISRLLVIADSVIPANGGTGLGWPMDGCVHPIYDPSGICVVGQRVGAQRGSWAPILFVLGPITIVAAAVNGLAQGLCHGERGDLKMVVTNNNGDPTLGSGGTGAPYKIFIFTGHTLTQTAPGNITATRP
jgi:hypothetical protein